MLVDFNRNREWHSINVESIWEEEGDSSLQRIVRCLGFERKGGLQENWLRYKHREDWSETKYEWKGPIGNMALPRKRFRVY
jgi:hypothetical protein